MDAVFQFTLPPECECLGSAVSFADDIHQILSRTPLLESLDLNDTQLLCNHMTCFSAPRGCMLLHQGDTSGFMLILLTGRAELLLTDESGADHSMASLGPGRTIGEMSMIDQTPHSVSCVAQEPVDVVVLTREAFRDILLTMPRLGNKLMLAVMHSLAERLHRAQFDLMHQWPKSAPPWSATIPGPL
ncbi:Crp/Fnr family transcriptional regulator [Aquabacterium sp. A08]|uniref:Crp/Fnr family transcriptional regulator n=1 Tax=Aquabacterium sp. A08 TaxID=2718532 RepID=UPI00141D863D|nr:cyclic nucleotide-binding domain-containing protein [Aquabacterium sp. A08]NIC41057.1 cyclic nucleotide-binding domain-containing protein [Aquabacterium sp. A08]